MQTYLAALKTKQVVVCSIVCGIKQITFIVQYAIHAPAALCKRINKTRMRETNGAQVRFREESE